MASDAMTAIDDDPQQAFDDTVRAWTSQGWRIETSLRDQVVLVHGHRVNHVLHLILTLITLGLWAVVWLVVTIAGGERRMVIGIDPVTGTITHRKG